MNKPMLSRGCAHETDPAKAAWLNATSDLICQQGVQANNLAIDAASARLVDDFAQRLVLPSPSSNFRPTYLRPTNPTPPQPPHAPKFISASCLISAA
jgi:hypothetical protein